jgi:hypothetical protein
VKYYRCTACGLTKAATAYARWGLASGLWSRLCRAEGACDECMSGFTKYPLSRPYPVVIVGDRRSGNEGGPNGGIRELQPHPRPDGRRPLSLDPRRFPDDLLSPDALLPSN